MDFYDDLPPPPPYSEFDPGTQNHEVPNHLRIPRKPVPTTPSVQVRAVDSLLRPAGQLRHGGRSTGDLRAQGESQSSSNRKLAQSPHVQVEPIYGSGAEFPRVDGPRRLLHGARSVGNLRRANIEAMETEIRPELPPRPQLALRTEHQPPPITDSQMYLSPMDADPRRPRTSHASPLGSYSRASSAHSNRSASPNHETPPLSTKSSSSSIHSAYREARHYVGGLVPHPTESTKHFTILRHSHGLVFYQGNSTTLAVTIFADVPLPLDRTIWLQNRGWSGNTGMKVKGLMGANGSWLNVTPTIRVRAEQLKAGDERAWQRDISAFQKKADRNLSRHVLRETAIVRIPIEAGDGYFQLVLCLGDRKKTLCSSPIFRVVSTSATPYSIKGASLRTLPLELGALAASTYLQNTAGRVIRPVTAASSVVQGRVQKYMPAFWVQKAASEATGVVSGAFNGHHTQTNGGILSGEGNDLTSGPRDPYPLCFACRSDQIVDTSDQFSTPTINLSKLPDAVSQRLSGYYFGWSRVMGQDAWHEVVFSALITSTSQLSQVNINTVSRKIYTIRLIRSSHDDFSPLNGGSKLELNIMGFIRPDETSQRAALEQGILNGDEAASEAAVLADVNDMAMTLSILSEPAWSPRGDSASGRGNQGSGIAAARDAAMRQVGKIPLHKVGVRSAMGDVTGVMVSSGFYVVR